MGKNILRQLMRHNQAALTSQLQRLSTIFLIKTSSESLVETLLMRGQKICFPSEVRKIIFELSFVLLSGALNLSSSLLFTLIIYSMYDSFLNPFSGGHLDVVQLIVTAGADIDSQDNRKVSCLMAAFRKGHIKVVKWMVKHVNQFPSDGDLSRYIATITDKVRF